MVQTLVDLLNAKFAESGQTFDAEQAVTWLQNQLLALKYFLETYVANGVYDQETVDAVKTLQQTELASSEVDRTHTWGQVDEETFNKINELVEQLP